MRIKRENFGYWGPKKIEGGEGLRLWYHVKRKLYCNVVCWSLYEVSIYNKLRWPQYEPSSSQHLLGHTKHVKCVILPSRITNHYVILNSKWTNLTTYQWPLIINNFTETPKNNSIDHPLTCTANTEIYDKVQRTVSIIWNTIYYEVK